MGNNTSGIGVVTWSGSGLCFMSQVSGAPQFQSCPGGSGTVSAGSPQNSGRLAKFGALNEIVNSLISESGSDVTTFGNILGRNPLDSATAMVIQNTSAVAALTVNTVNLRVIVKDLEIQGHIITSGTAPLAAVETDAGTGASCSVAGNDSAGTITFTTGPDVVSGDMCTISFNTAYGAAPRVLLSADNLVSATMQAAITGRTINEFTVSSANLPNNSTEYVFNYIVIQ